ncbi:dephospho-CoA kinase [Thalassobius sp. S69A]|uniref:dephospho-CoA kinase n=1 Tax=unclassified Thalassovita TaxID=2619711 RepID=UPI000C0CEB65|nr:dephospho-CoA kinase [Paracoccaceae bacterium]MBT26556.1 dephospho-CoA kinase [Paracoccaceae bacterium]
MSFKLGLTGSIGMGKSTTAKILAEEGCAIWDADAAVHRLYSSGGKAVAPMQSLFPDAIVDGAVSRDRLRAIIQADPSALKKIETIVHPLVAEDRADFIAAADADILVFDVPLMFETGGDRNMDAVLVVSVPENIQRDRVMARGTMTEAQFQAIKAKQMPDAEKRARADFVVITDSLGHARAQIQDILEQIRKGQAIA